MPQQIAHLVDNWQTARIYAASGKWRAVRLIQGVSVAVIASYRLQVILRDLPRRGDSSGQHGSVVFATECAAVQFAAPMPVLADSLAVRSPLRDLNLRGVLSYAIP